MDDSTFSDTTAQPSADERQHASRRIASMNAPNLPLNSSTTVERLVLASWRPYAWLSLVILLLYGQTFFFREFTYLDDYYMIVEYQYLLTDPQHVLNALSEDVFHKNQGGMFYRPMLTYSLMVDAFLGGADPAVYHISNVLYHLLACCMLMMLFKELGLSRWFSFCSALVVAIHPAMAQAVAWIPGRNESLLSIFVLLSFVGLLRFLSTLKLRWWAIHLLSFALALLTKENTLAVLPLYALVFVSKRKAIPTPMYYLLFVLGWFFVILYWSYAREAAMIMPLTQMTVVATTIANNAWALLSFFGLTVWPVDIFNVAVAEDLPLVPGLLGLFFMLAVVFRSKEKSWFLVLLGASWFVLFLLPTFYRHPDALYATRFFEHRVYLPLMGFLLMVAGGAVERLWKRWAKTIPVLFGLVCIIFSVLTLQQSRSFADAMTFSELAARTSPRNPFYHLEITMMDLPASFRNSISFSKQSTEPPDYYAKLRALEKQLEVDREPSQSLPDRSLCLGAVYFAMGRLKRAQEELLGVLEAGEETAVVHYNLGVLYYHGHFEKLAEQHWLKTIEFNPAYADAHRNLCYVYYQRKDYATALSHAQSAQNFGATIPNELLGELTQNSGDR